MLQKRKYLTVTALTKYLKKKLEVDPHLQEVYLKGEISNFKHHSSGHMYLTIKDNTSQIRAVMFSSAARKIKFKPENGMNLLFTGYLSLFEKSGQYQYYINEMLPDGIGSLYLAYEQLKEKLSKSGYFDEVHKKQIKKFPEKIAVLTSPTGAAIRDIIITIQNKYPITSIIVIPITVQGDQAKYNIENAIKEVNQRQDIDTIILGRGGGSIEDLWAFNEEIVVQAIFDSEIPIISGVGHETDFTLTDFVADLRAPTPTGAANAAVPSLDEVSHKVSVLQQQLTSYIRSLLLNKQNRLQQIKSSYVFQKPEQFFRTQQIYLDQLYDRLNKSTSFYLDKRKDLLEKIQYKLNQQRPQKKLDSTREKIGQLNSALNKNYQQLLKEKRNQILTSVDKLIILNPLNTMKRGYAIVYNENDNVISQAEQVSISENINVKLSNGSIDCTINSIQKDDD